jgi:RNA polymerase primary sigma factor
MGISYNELISEANDALIKAIDRFDLTQDVKVISYAKWWIKQGIEAAIKTKNRMPESDLPEDRSLYFEQNDGDDKEDAIDDVFAVENAGDDEREKTEFIESLMTVLSQREADIINLYYGRFGEKAKTLEEIGEKYKLTKERVRQIMEKALLKVRSKCMLVDSKYLSN